MSSSEQIYIKTIGCQSALNRLKRKIPYGWDLNIYRGCGHGCKYCYAIYSHDYLSDGNFFGNVYVKDNIVEALESELKSEKWNREIVNIGGVTDSYQPCEKEQKIMPAVLKLFIKYKTPIIISTKSDLILRDYDLIDELSRITYVNVASSIITTDENLRKTVEPGSTESGKRFEMLKTFRKTNASTGIHVMPIIPFLTDTSENFESLCAAAAAANVHYMLPGTLYLRGKTRKYFFNFIAAHFPEIRDGLSTLYTTGGADRQYKEKLYEMVNILRNKYRLSGSWSKPMKEKLHNT
ncbi:MAG: radical SAM protein [Prolixibacteraceae bacterium]|nr:radical SAM protein [Prolixibacteraceae bacterium]